MNRNVIIGAVILLAIAGSTNIRAAEPVELKEGQERYRLGRHLEILEDAQGRLTFADILSAASESRSGPARKRRRASAFQTPPSGFGSE